MIDIDKWTDIKDYEGLYQINKNGDIRSLYNYRKYNILKPRIKKGYYQIGLRKNNKRTWYAVHRLVAQTFIPNPNKLPCINHKDENKLNNCVDNLEWCTHLYNNLYGNRREKIKDKTSKKVLQYDKNGNFIQSYKSIAEASRINNINQSSIVSCCKHYKNYPHAGGYVWIYKSEVI